MFRRVIVSGAQGAHGIKQAGLGPVLLFAATGKNDVLFAQLNLLHRITNTVRTGGTGGRDGVVDTLDFERGGQTGRDRTAHGACDPVGADTLDAFLPHNIRRFDNVL